MLFIRKGKKKKEHILNLLAKMMEQYVLPNITQCATTIAYFSLKMFRIRFDTSTFVINFINDDFAFKLQLSCLNLITPLE
jgi:hypothetical protein